MISCSVEMWGLAREVSGAPEVSVQLADNAGLKDLIAALRNKVPALDGTVVVKGEDRLDDACAFYINGQFYQEENSLKLRNGDSIRLLTLATGG